MAEGFDLGTAWVQISPSFKGLKGEVAKALRGADDEARAAGDRAGSSLRSALLGKVAGVGLAVAAAIGFKNIASEAVKASDATQKFKTTLNFAGLDGKQIDRLAKSTRKYADDTIYDLGDIQNVTAQLAANSVKDYDKIAVATGNLNAIAGGNAETFRSMGMAITQTAGAGKLTTENWNQVANAVPGASGKLQEAMRKNGAFTGDFREAMAKSKITSEEFNQALLELGMDEAAQKAATSTKTMEGAWGNLQATIVGGFSDFITKIKPGLTGALNWISGALESFFSWFGNAFNGVVALLAKGDFTSAFSKAFNVDEDSKVVDWVLRIRDAIVGLFNLVVKGDFTESLRRVFDIEEDNAFVDMILIAREAVIDFVTSIPSRLQEMFSWVATNKDWILPLTIGIGAAVATFHAFTTVVNVWKSVMTTARAVQVAFNAVMTANPIILVISAITALVSALIWFFTQTDAGRVIWANFSTYLQSVWNGLQVAWNIVWSAVKTVYDTVISPVVNAVIWSFQTAWGFIHPIFDAIKLTILGPIILAFRLLQSVVSEVWNKVGGIISTIWHTVIMPIFNVVSATVNTLFVQPFETAVNAIKTAWDKLKGWFAAPINWVIRHVINGGVIAFINTIVGALGLNSLKISNVKPINVNAYAKGGLARPGWALVGEEGPELVNFSQPSRVYTASQTAQALGRDISPTLIPDRLYSPDEAMLAARAVSTQDPHLLNLALGDNPSQALLPIGGFLGAFGDWVSDAWHGVTEWVSDIGGKVIKFVRGRLADAAGLVIHPLQSLIKGHVSGVWRDFFVGAGDKLLNWIAGVDGETKEVKVEKVYAEAGRLLDTANAGSALASLVSGGASRPLAGGRLTSPFGVSRYGGMHSGIDLAAPIGTPVFAYRDGVVTRAGWNALAGRSGIGIVLAHAGGLGSYYGHLSAALVGAGAAVRAGQQIGRVGNTGNSTGPHLHWEISTGGNPQRVINPLPYLKFDDGGWLPPGVNRVVNETGRPEPVFTAAQWQTMRDLAGTWGGPGLPTILVIRLEDGRELRAFVDERATRALENSARDLAGRRR